VIDLRLASAANAANVDVAAHRKAMQQALGSEFLASCTTKMTDAQVDCALGATDAAAVAACGPTTTSN
jgi:hypothetical protein